MADIFITRTPLTPLQRTVKQQIEELPGQTAEDIANWFSVLGINYGEVMNAIYGMIFNDYVERNKATGALTVREGDL